MATQSKYYSFQLFCQLHLIMWLSSDQWILIYYSNNIYYIIIMHMIYIYVCTHSHTIWEVSLKKWKWLSPLLFSPGFHVNMMARAGAAIFCHEVEATCGRWRSMTVTGTGAPDDWADPTPALKCLPEYRFKKEINFCFFKATIILGFLSLSAGLNPNWSGRKLSFYRNEMKKKEEEIASSVILHALHGSTGSKGQGFLPLRHTVSCKFRLYKQDVQWPDHLWVIRMLTYQANTKQNALYSENWPVSASHLH